ncbi:HAMP domain-containing histidine kinase [Sphingomonas psychrotolerans]|uniref:histidine kinase n=1 Tax=Sphingomonas psychrotolerans TaxID=1327635 RepID=A0ABU3N770_9SPHN|nr:HAMP domain-containing sensor histidine kinase [Sphingomonas psychrotolerans]MDT8760238.1 HAMP domain-containing histidine kinase [Sphingomonas psychrotolerans]
MRIYLAQLASLIVASFLFGIAHMRFGAGAPNMTRVGAHISMLLVLMAIALAVAVVAFPVVRRLTRRLEHLQASVEAWGAGDLSARVAVEGKDEVALLAISFNQSAARVEALMAAQSILLANASHELRTPLARIRMAVELLGDAAPAPVRDEIARNVGELDQLVGEVLLASRLDTAAALERPLEMVDLTALAAEECARVQADCEAEMTTISGDSTLLRRMIRNLLENAQRHGGGTPITLVLASTARDSVQLDVCDEGSGVPEGEREAIFAPFYRMQGASEVDGGYGLGLSLVRQIARRHGGEVCYVPRASAGGCFRVTLPREAS